MSKSIDWFVTPKCNDKCKFCYAPLVFKDYKLGLQSYYDICDRISELGFEYVTLCGGEPTLNGYIVEIVKYLYTKGIRVVFYSNGIEKEIIKKVVPFIHYLSLPIDGIEETTGLLRSKEQNEKVIELLDEIAADELEVKVKIGTVVNKVNKDYLELIYDIIKKCKMINCWRLYQFSAGEVGGKNKHIYNLSEDEYWSCINKLKQKVSDTELLSCRTREESKGYCIIMNQKGDLFRYEEKYIDLQNNIFEVEMDDIKRLYDIDKNIVQKQWITT